MTFCTATKTCIYSHFSSAFTLLIPWGPHVIKKDGNIIKSVDSLS